MQKQIEFYKNKLTYEMDASDLWGAMENGENIIALDARKSFAFDKEHISNAINFPHEDINEESTKHLDKTQIYVCYCDGIGCNASTKAALKMTKLGFKVKELIGGMEWWKFDGYATTGIYPSKGAQIKSAC